MTVLICCTVKNDIQPEYEQPHNNLAGVEVNWWSALPYFCFWLQKKVVEIASRHTYPIVISTADKYKAWRKLKVQVGTFNVSYACMACMHMESTGK